LRLVRQQKDRIDGAFVRSVRNQKLRFAAVERSARLAVAQSRANFFDLVKSMRLRIRPTHLVLIACDKRRSLRSAEPAIRRAETPQSELTALLDPIQCKRLHEQRAKCARSILQVARGQDQWSSSLIAFKQSKPPTAQTVHRLRLHLLPPLALLQRVRLMQPLLVRGGRPQVMRVQRQAPPE
jgi:hypothetical protein